LSPKNNYHKFKGHFRKGGFLYALDRGIKYLVFLLAKQKERFRRNSITLVNEEIKVVYSGCSLNIFYKERPVTRGIGLSVAINTLGQWTDTARADWQIQEKGKNYFKLKIIFKELPLSQVWTIKLESKHRIEWNVDINMEEWTRIDEFRVVCHVNSRYKTWISKYEQADFPRLSSHWYDLCLGELPTPLVGVRFPVEGDFLPSLLLENRNGSFLPLVQNPPLNTDAHIIGLRKVNEGEANAYSSGITHLFSGKIVLFEEDSSLDDKLEDLRQNYLERELKQRTKNKKIQQHIKVVLANLPWQKGGKSGVRAGSRWPHIKDESEGGYLPFPFFLAYATSLLCKHDIDALMMDAIAEHSSEEKFLIKIQGMNLNYLVAETSIPSFYDDLKILKKISQAGVRIILCGPNFEIYQPQFLKDHPFISFVLYGEYEFSLLDLLTALREGKDVSGVKGLIYNDNGTIKKNPPREPFDINLLPWPQRDGLAMDKYLDAPGEMRVPSAQMLASRGCPFKCQFCLWPQVIYQGYHYRVRDVRDVVDEMEYLVREKGFHSVYFDDDTFNIGKKRMLEFCREIKKRGLNKIQWAIMARPDLMDEEILDSMKEAGVWAIKYGLESSDQALVDQIGKDMDLEKAEKMIRYTKKLRIRTHLTFTFGLPGETKETIEKTIQRALELDPFSIQFSITTPFPGTKYFEILDKKDFIITKDFSSYDGHSKSVIKLENLTPGDLEISKIKAYRIWADHLRKKRGLLGDIKRFFYYAKSKNLIYSVYKTHDYFRYVLLKRKRYLNHAGH